MDVLAVAALEPVRVQQRQERLEVLFLAAVRGRGHQQQVPGDPAEQLAELVPLGRLQLAAEVVRGHLVRLVDDHHVPLGPGQVSQQRVVARDLVHPHDQARVLLERVLRRRRGRDQVVGQDVESQPELVVQLVLPLVHQPAGDHDQAPLQVAAQREFLDEQARHDGLARARVVGQQEPQRLVLAQQVAIDRLDLVRQRIQVAGGHRQHRVELRRHLDPQRFHAELEIGRVPAEARCFAGRDDS